MTDPQRPDDTATNNVPTPPIYQQPPVYQQPGAYPPPTYQQPPQGYAPQPGYAPQQGAYPPQQPGYPPQQPGYPPQPGYAPPPAQSWGQTPAPTYWGPADAGQYGKGSSVLAVLAGIPLLLFGLLITLGGAAVLFVRTLVDEAITSGISNGSISAVDGKTVRDAIAVVAVVILIFGVLQILAAIGIWAHKGWGRWLGLIFGVLGTLLGLLAVATSRSGLSGSSNIGGALFVLVPYAFVLIAMIIGGAHFRRRTS
jgi:hypothetical protein